MVDLMRPPLNHEFEVTVNPNLDEPARRFFVVHRSCSGAAELARAVYPDALLWVRSPIEPEAVIECRPWEQPRFLREPSSKYVSAESHAREKLARAKAGIRRYAFQVQRLDGSFVRFGIYAAGIISAKQKARRIAAPAALVEAE